MLETHAQSACFDGAAAVAFVVHLMTSQNCIYMALCDRSQGSETGQTPDNFYLKDWKLTLKTFFSGEYLDILAISCDSFDEDVNALIGRGQGKKSHVENLHKLRQWCREYAVAFKINSVINRFNVEEDMNEQIKALNPVRWKVKK